METKAGGHVQKPAKRSMPKKLKSEKDTILVTVRVGLAA